MMTYDTIVASEEALREAMLTNDVAALDCLLADELVFVSLDGTIVGKQEDLASHRMRRLQLTKLAVIDRIIQDYGDTAVAIVLVEIDGTFDGLPAIGKLRYTRVWCRRNNGWQIVAGHMSAVV
jgi:ketosteroid isomerase-like protein